MLYLDFKNTHYLENIYNIEEEDFDRLKNDYESYLKTGNPVGGIYKRKIDKNICLLFETDKKRTGTE
jgi:hypothetical protein